MKNQLLDNSTFLEAGELLLGLNLDKDDDEHITRRYNNLLTLMHGLLIGDKLHYVGIRRTSGNKENPGVQYLYEKSPISKIILPFDYASKEEVKREERVLIEDSRNKVLNAPKLYEEVVEHVAEDINILKMLKDELITYAIPEGLKHYWNNVGYSPEESLEEEALKLHRIVAGAFSRLKVKNSESEDIESINDLADDIVYDLEDLIKENGQKTDNILKHKWLAFVSHIVRTGYYISLANLHNVVYSPLGTRGYFAKNILKYDTNIQATSYINDKKLKLLSYTFLYVMKECRFERLSFLDALMQLKNKDNGIVKKVSNKLQDLLLKSEIDEKEINEIKIDILKETVKPDYHFNEQTIGFTLQKNEERQGIIHVDEQISLILNKTPLLNDFKAFINS